jgi:hypothetical protein
VAPGGGLHVSPAKHGGRGRAHRYREEKAPTDNSRGIGAESQLDAARDASGIRISRAERRECRRKGNRQSDEGEPREQRGRPRGVRGHRRQRYYARTQDGADVERCALKGAEAPAGLMPVRVTGFR